MEEQYEILSSSCNRSNFEIYFNNEILPALSSACEGDLITSTNRHLVERMVRDMLSQSMSYWYQFAILTVDLLYATTYHQLANDFPARYPNEENGIIYDVIVSANGQFVRIVVDGMEAFLLDERIED